MAKRRGNGEGTVGRTVDGRWVARLSLPGGRRKAFYGRTREEAHAKMTRARAEHDRGLPIVGERLTVGEFLTRWLEDHARPAVRPSTFASYKMHVETWWVPALGRVRLAKLEAGHVQHAMNAWSKAGTSPRTIRLRRATLRAALELAVSWELVARNVARLAKGPRVEERTVHTLEVSEVTTLLRVLEGHRLRGVVSVAACMGLRQGEILGLSWDDVDLEAGTLTVHRALQRVNGRLVLVEPKSRKANRTLPIPPIVTQCLREHRAAQGRERLAAGDGWKNALGLVFTTPTGAPMDGPSVTAALGRVLEAAGLPRIRFHDLRHTCASILLSEGMDTRHVSDVLGHSNITLTLSTYAHVPTSNASRSADVMERALAGRK